MTNELKSCRAKFEAWARTQYLAIHRNGGEQYVNTPTHHTWCGYEAGYEAGVKAERELCKHAAFYDIIGTGEVACRSCKAVFKANRVIEAEQAKVMKLRAALKKAKKYFDAEQDVYHSEVEEFEQVLKETE